MSKKKFCKFVSLVVSLILMTAVLFAGCSGNTLSSSPNSTNVLKVGVRDDILDFSSLHKEAGKYYGLEVDLAYDLAEKLGYDGVEFTTVTPDDRKDTLLNGDIDCLIAAYSISDSRKENFDFSEPYYTDETNLMVEKSSLITDISGLGGQTIGILSGSNAGPLLNIKFSELGLIDPNPISNDDEKTVYDRLTIVKYASYEELYQALEEGRVDAACMDGCIANTYMTDSTMLLEGSIADQQYGVATQKDSDLSQPIADAVAGLLEDGTIDKLIEKWL